MRRARGDFPLLNRSQIVSLSWADTKLKEDKNDKSINVSPTILGPPLIYLGGPSMCGKH